MTHMMGAALLICGAVGAGVTAYLSVGVKAKVLGAYVSMLSILRSEIFPGLATLENALSAALQVEGAAPFVRGMLDGVRKFGGAEVSKCWLEACGDAPPEIRGILEELSPILGRYSAEEQSAAIERAEKRIAEHRDRAEEKRRRSGRMYITFGVCGGIAAAVMLL